MTLANPYPDQLATAEHELRLRKITIEQLRVENADMQQRIDGRLRKCAGYSRQIEELEAKVAALKEMARLAENVRVKAKREWQEMRDQLQERD